MGVSDVISRFDIQSQMPTQIEFEHRINNGEGNVALVALCIQVKKIDVREIFTFISFPRKNLIIVYI